MVNQASRHNRKRIAAGRVELIQGTVSSLPYEDRRFTKAFAVNTFQFWPRSEEDLREVRRVLVEGGLLLLCLRMRDPARRFQFAPGFTRKEVEAVKELLRAAGYHDIRTGEYRAGREITCVLANR